LAILNPYQIFYYLPKTHNYFCLSPFPPGIKVLVSDGREGYVLNNKNSLRPIIGFPDGTTVDLSKQMHLYVREIME